MAELTETEIKEKIQEIDNILSKMDYDDPDRWVYVESRRMYNVQLEEAQHPERFTTIDLGSALDRMLAKK